MGILSWEKPKQVVSREEYESIVADSAPPGVYTPNMSKEDMMKWRAKKIGGDFPRVEIRTSMWSQIVLIVARDGDKHASYNIRLSMNGPIIASWDKWAEFTQAIEEARDALNEETT
ncbi:MAG: hypothetical protein WC822_06790 [Candidatus Paceibacterota bacterium]